MLGHEVYDVQCPALCYLHAHFWDSQNLCAPDAYSVLFP